MNKNKVLVAMSGGVDSSVTAALIKQQGYEAIGVTFAPYTSDKPHCHCYSEYDAKTICDQLGIEHHFVDYSELFKREIIDYFVDEYLQGRTPNPCTKCNPLIKFGKLLELADEFDAQWIATGHYVGVRRDELLNRSIITRSDNLLKDQSYVLWGLKEYQISRSMFPIGNLTKNDTRELAKEFDFHIHDKMDSQDVCFIPADDYKEFLWEEKGDFLNNMPEGYIIFNGKIVGKHKGFPFYTIGQRHGLGISHSEPVYVKKIIPESNTIEIGTISEIMDKGLIAHSVNLIKYDEIKEPTKFLVKIRYNDKGREAICYTKNGKLYVEFIEPRSAVTPGQSVVLYEHNDLVGGAIIESKI
ncbi:MAG: tRNA 2-thiouridine(34) synthase MnmA [Ignavibacteria bacterium GWF2_33_9]|nr:MAG: tRNA 2-thiouridine(34) synthase MnmA [Ignavibacteria bacterium GWF2_33_9]